MSSVETLGSISTLSDLTVEGNSSVTGDFAVIGEIISVSDLTAQSNFYVSGDAQFSGNVISLNDSSVLGNFSVTSNVEIDGDTYLNSNLNVSGSAEIAGSLIVMSSVETLGSISTLSDIDCFGNINAHLNLFASGTITAVAGFSGSLTRLSNGTSAFLGGSGIIISSSSNGAITISTSASGNTSKGYISGTSSFIDNETGIINFGPSGANIGTLSTYNDEVIDVYLNGVFLAYGYDITQITSTTFTLASSLNDTLQNEDIISVVLRNV